MILWRWRSQQQCGCERKRRGLSTSQADVRGGGGWSVETSVREELWHVELQVRYLRGSIGSSRQWYLLFERTRRRCLVLVGERGCTRGCYRGLLQADKRLAGGRSNEGSGSEGGRLTYLDGLLNRKRRGSVRHIEDRVRIPREFKTRLTDNGQPVCCMDR